MDFQKAIKGVSISSVFDAYVAGPPTHVVDVEVDQKEEPEAPRQQRPRQQKQRQGPTHPLLGVSASMLETREFMNTVIFISTGVFILFVADAFTRVGRRQARMDAMAEILRQRLG